MLSIVLRGAEPLSFFIKMSCRWCSSSKPRARVLLLLAITTVELDGDQTEIRKHPFPLPSLNSNYFAGKLTGEAHPMLPSAFPFHNSLF